MEKDNLFSPKIIPLINLSDGYYDIVSSKGYFGITYQVILQGPLNEIYEVNFLQLDRFLQDFENNDFVAYANLVVVKKIDFESIVNSINALWNNGYFCNNKIILSEDDKQKMIGGLDNWCNYFKEENLENIFFEHCKKNNIYKISIDDIINFMDLLNRDFIKLI